MVSPFLGGGFGSKGPVWSHVILAALAAKHVGRPVKLVLERPQMFGPVGGRPLTEQQVLLAADRDGHLVAIRHEVISHTSVMEDYAEPATSPTRALYACPNGATTQRVVPLNVGVPTFQRAPARQPARSRSRVRWTSWRTELGIDALELRLRNFPKSKRPAASAGRATSYANATDWQASASVGRGALRIRARCAMGVGS